MEKPLADRCYNWFNPFAPIVYDADMGKIKFVGNIVQACHKFSCAGITDHPWWDIDRQIPNGKSLTGANRKRVDVSGAHSRFTLFIL